MQALTTSEFFQDLSTGALCAIPEAFNNSRKAAHGLTIREHFYVYPDGSIVQLVAIGDTHTVRVLSGDDADTFRTIHHHYFH